MQVSPEPDVAAQLHRLVENELPGRRGSNAIALTLWLIVAALVAYAIASMAMVTAQPANAVAGIDPQTDEVEFAGDAA